MFEEHLVKAELRDFRAVIRAEVGFSGHAGHVTRVLHPVRQGFHFPETPEDFRVLFEITVRLHAKAVLILAGDQPGA